MTEQVVYWTAFKNRKCRGSCFGRYTQLVVVKEKRFSLKTENAEVAQLVVALP